MIGEHWEIDVLTKEKDGETYFEDGKFKAPSLAADLIFNAYDPGSITNVNRGWLVTQDNKEIWRYNGAYYEPDGECILRNITQCLLKNRCTTYYKNEVINWVKDNNQLRIDREFFDSNIHLINLENGIYNIKTKEFEEHTPSWFFAHCIPITYDPDEKINQIQQFLKDILYPEDIPTLQELAGYLFYRKYTYQKAFMFDGDGSNGKSTLINLLVALIGQENVANVSLQDLIYRRFARSQLYRKLANMYSDLSDNAVKDTGIFKMLTGGDPIFADQKFKEPFTFKNHAKLIFSCNKLPMSGDDTDAYFRRWILISFPNKFEGKDCDPNILAKITTQSEMSGFFNWAMKGLERLLKNNDFSYNKSTEIIREEYERKSSPLLAFIKDCLEEDYESVELKEDVYNCYKEYCKKEKLPVKASNTFSRELKQNITKLDEGQVYKGGKRTWRGIRIVA